MNHAISFMPVTRRIARRQRSRKNVWIAINAVGLLLGGTAIAATRSQLQRSESSAMQATDAAQARLDSIVEEQITLAAELTRVESRLVAHAEATQHPDWSILLAYISRIGADEIALEGFVLERGDSADLYSVALAGAARSQNAVTRFLLALERSGVFASTTLVRSNRTDAGTYTFAIACRIGEEPAPPPEEENG